MTVRAATTDDLDWIVGVLQQRRRALVRWAPVFWREAEGAEASHRAFLAFLLAEGGALAFRGEEGVLIATPRGDGWLVDDFVLGTSDEGRELWAALDASVGGAAVRFVCPFYEADRAAFAREAGLEVAETWWLVELPGSTGCEPGLEVSSAGGDGVAVAAPPVYDPGGAVLFLPAATPGTDLSVAVDEALRLGAPAVVVSQAAGDDALAARLSRGGFRRHCDYYVGPIRPLGP